MAVLSYFACRLDNWLANEQISYYLRRYLLVHMTNETDKIAKAITLSIQV